VLLLNECLFLFISLSTQSGNFWIYPRITCATKTPSLENLPTYQSINQSINQSIGLVRKVKPSTLQWTVRMGKTNTEFWWWGGHLQKWSFRGSRRQEDNIKLCLKEIVWEDGIWIKAAQNRVQQRC
jgi:hypothetical protein